MVEDRMRVGPLLCAVGSVLLGISVFSPWYGVSLTASGAASAQQTLNSVAQQFGNAGFQAQANAVGAGFSAYAGHQITTLTAHQLLKDMSVVLLILAAIALVAALLHLASTSAPALAGGGQIAAVGLVATLCVLFRMVVRPAPTEGVFSLSLGWGIWLALGGSVAIVVGGLWRGDGGTATDAPAQTWDKLSGWTPEG
jgi:hypothetical protein